MMRLCSRNLPTMDRILIRDDMPSTPGRRQQMPRTTKSISTPASLASYSFSMIAGSTSEFIFAQIEAGRRSEEHTSELQALMPISYDRFGLKNKHKQMSIHVIHLIT